MGSNILDVLKAAPKLGTELLVGSAKRLVTEPNVYSADIPDEVNETAAKTAEGMVALAGMPKSILDELRGKPSKPTPDVAGTIKKLSITPEASFSMSDTIENAFKSIIDAKAQQYKRTTYGISDFFNHIGGSARFNLGKLGAAEIGGMIANPNQTINKYVPTSPLKIPGENPGHDKGKGNQVSLYDLIAGLDGKVIKKGDTEYNALAGGFNRIKNKKKDKKDKCWNYLNQSYDKAKGGYNISEFKKKVDNDAGLKNFLVNFKV